MGDEVRTGLERLRGAAASGRLDELCGRNGVYVLVAFGSAARGEPRPEDLDIAAAFVPGGGADVVALLDDLAELAGTGAIDLMSLDRAGPVAKERALVEGVPLYERERGGFARRQMAAMLERMDTEWLRRLDLEAMAG